MQGIHSFDERCDKCYEVVLQLVLTLLSYLGFLMIVLFVLCTSRDLSFVMFGFENQS